MYIISKGEGSGGTVSDAKIWSLLNPNDKPTVKSSASFFECPQEFDVVTSCKARVTNVAGVPIRLSELEVENLS